MREGADDAASLAQTLVESGISSAKGADAVTQLARLSTRVGEIPGYTVLGSYPEYIEHAHEKGYTFFNMPDEVWGLLRNAGEAFVWAVNRRFLDERIAAGDSFIIQRGVVPGTNDLRRVGVYLQMEIDYLLELGYQWVDNMLVPGG